MCTAFTSGSPLRETRAKQTLSASRFKEIKGSLGDSEREGGGREGRDEERRREQGKGGGKEREGEGRDRRRAEAKESKLQSSEEEHSHCQPSCQQAAGRKNTQPKHNLLPPRAPTRAFYG